MKIRSPRREDIEAAAVRTGFELSAAELDGAAMLPPPYGVWGMPKEMLASLPGHSTDIAKSRAEGQEIMKKLGYGPDKLRLVLNRADSTLGIRVADVEHSIGRKVEHTIVSDGRSVVYALNRGVPFFLSNREAQVSQDVLRLATAIAGTTPVASAASDTKSAAKAATKKSLFAWR